MIGQLIFVMEKEHSLLLMEVIITLVILLMMSIVVKELFKQLLNVRIKMEELKETLSTILVYLNLLFIMDLVNYKTL
mgnify:CR=1 FL=1